MRLEENKVYYYDVTRQFTVDIIQNDDILLDILSYARNGFIYYRRFDTSAFYKHILKFCKYHFINIDFKLLSYTDNDSMPDI